MITSPPSMHSPTEQTRYWMWTRRNLLDRPLLTSFFLPPSTTSAYESWEEQAFARDSAGDLGGSVWPPRSYTCSFCQREFRSAQALGGHMNVHRRDRARLKQASSPTSETTDEDAQHLNPSGSSFICSPNPNSVALGFQVASTLSLKEEICSQRSKVSPSFADESVCLELGRENWKSNQSGSTLRRMRDFFYEEEEISSNKKLKSDLMFTLDMRSTGGGLQLLKTEGMKLRPNPVEELDLELRLGESPKVEQSCSIIVIE